MPGRVCDKHGTPQYVPAGEECPYCEPETVPIALSSCDGGYLVPSAIAEKIKRDMDRDFPVAHVNIDRPIEPAALERARRVWRNKFVLQARREGKTAAQETMERAMREGTDRVTMFWSSALPTPPTREQMLAGIDKAFRSPARPPRPLNADGIERLKRSWNEKYGPNRYYLQPQDLLLDEPSPEERAAWAVCEFLRWGATPRRDTYGESPVAHALRAVRLAKETEDWFLRWGRP